MQSLQPEPNAQYKGVYEALKRIIQTEGVFRPLRGLNITMMGAGPAHALYFACYERVKRSLSDIIRSGGNSNLANGTSLRVPGATNQQTVTLTALHAGPQQPGLGGLSLGCFILKPYPVYSGQNKAISKNTLSHLNTNEDFHGM